MSEQDPYFQFPLCAFTLGKTVEERLQHIVNHSVVESGCSFWLALDEDNTRKSSKQYRDYRQSRQILIPQRLHVSAHMER